MHTVNIFPANFFHSILGRFGGDRYKVYIRSRAAFAVAKLIEVKFSFARSSSEYHVFQVFPEVPVVMQIHQQYYDHEGEICIIYNRF